MGSKRLSINRLLQAPPFALVACAIISTSIGSANPIAGAQPLPQISCEELISQLAMHESRLLKLKVKSQLWVDRREPNSLTWEPTPVYASCTAWFDGKPNGKARIDVHREILEWEYGAAPYSEESYSVGFDGRQGRTARYSVGPMGKAVAISKGVIYPEAPEVIRGKWPGAYTGRTASMFFSCCHFACPEDKSLSEFLSEYLSEFGPFEVTWDTIAGTNCIRFGAGDPNYGHEYMWLDPARGFAFLRYERANVSRDSGELVPDGVVAVTKLTEAAPGLWYPTEAYYESRMGPGLGRTDRRLRYLASEVVANDPDFDESIFTLSFPAGCFVHDRIKDVGYRAGSPLDKLQQTLDKMVDETLDPETAP